MNASIRSASRNVGFTAAVLLSAVMAMQSQAAPVSGSIASESVQTLDEIWAQGEAVSRSIAAAEQDFFLLYNELNSDDQYDVHCGVMKLDIETMRILSKCQPQFAAGPASSSTALDFASIDTGANSLQIMVGGSYARRRATHNLPFKLLQSKSKDYAANLRQVENSDVRLQEKSRALDGLYQQMKLVQTQFVRAREQQLARGMTLRLRKNAGPRIL